MGPRDFHLFYSVRNTWLASDVQQTPTWNKPSCPSYRHSTSNSLTLGYKISCHGKKKCLNVDDDCVLFWCVPSPTHVPYRRRRQSKIFGIRLLFYFFNIFIQSLELLKCANCMECSFIDTNLIHNFFYINYIKFKFLYMFRGSSAHLQEVTDVNSIMEYLFCLFCNANLEIW